MDIVYIVVLLIVVIYYLMLYARVAKVDKNISILLQQIETLKDREQLQNILTSDIKQQLFSMNMKMFVSLSDEKRNEYNEVMNKKD